MPQTLNPQMKEALAARVRYYREMGIYDFYRRDVESAPSLGQPSAASEASLASQDSFAPHPEEERDDMVRKTVLPPVASDVTLAVSKAEKNVTDPVAALKLIREDIGDCKRCKLSQQGRKQIVFGVGDPRAELMFVGEAPGADEDQQGEPFVGRSGHLLNNMIKAMAISREQVYIANVVKCLPPSNRTPQTYQFDTCSPFLMRQIEVVQPKAIVAR